MCVYVCVLVLCVYSVTNTNTPTHSLPVDRRCGLYCKTFSKYLQNSRSLHFFTAVPHCFEDKRQNVSICETMHVLAASILNKVEVQLCLHIPHFPNIKKD